MDIGGAMVLGVAVAMVLGSMSIDLNKVINRNERQTELVVRDVGLLTM